MKNPPESKDVFEAGGGGRGKGGMGGKGERGDGGEGGKGGMGGVDVSQLGNSCATPHPQFMFII